MRRAKPVVVIPKARGGEQPPPPLRPGPRKIALIGTAPSVMYAPWHDESWEIWSHASSADRWPRVDRSFEMHPECVWRDAAHKQPYLHWLQRCDHPLYMLEHYPDIPMSRRYPREQVFDECKAFIGRPHFGSHADFMIAQAVREPRVTMIGLYGVHYVDVVKDGERLDQLLAFKFWLGVAVGRGIRILVPEGNPVFNTPEEIYGLESHSTTEKYLARLRREQAVAKTAPEEPFGFRADKLTPSDGAALRKLPPIPGLGHKPMPENWERFAHA